MLVSVPAEQSAQEPLAATVLGRALETLAEDAVEVELHDRGLQVPVDLERHRQPARRIDAEPELRRLPDEIGARRLRERRRHVEAERAVETDDPAAVEIEI